MCTWTLGIEISHTEGNHGYMLISDASPSQNLHSGKSYVKKIILILVILIILFSNLCQRKIEKFELEFVDVGILGTGFCFQGSH